MKKKKTNTQKNEILYTTTTTTPLPQPTWLEQDDLFSINVYVYYVIEKKNEKETKKMFLTMSSVSCGTGDERQIFYRFMYNSTYIYLYIYIYIYTDYYRNWSNVLFWGLNILNSE